MPNSIDAGEFARKAPELAGFFQQLEHALTSPLQYITVSNAYTIPAAGLDVVFCDARAAAFHVRMPIAKECPGKVVTLIKTDSSANAITVRVKGANDTLVGNSTDTELDAQYEIESWISDGIKTWYACNWRDHTHGGGQDGSNVPEANITFDTSAGHDHDGSNSKALARAALWVPASTMGLGGGAVASTQNYFVTVDIDAANEACFASVYLHAAPVTVNLMYIAQATVASDDGIDINTEGGAHDENFQGTTDSLSGQDTGAKTVNDTRVLDITDAFTPFEAGDVVAVSIKANADAVNGSIDMGVVGLGVEF